ncbi:TVP38/TMEM64 family protein [Belliella kenyensis]|uniref:TVP38/TMEM64 family membrane protein n=1 Tax=Belliella kenyensis TaxID=1472724 RepID=A0ABV8EP15_9BACT|nr:VTT domain-containing protein [Belliella kenyensis]MCH7403421.1 VTT domain-containing protein [Belliella kenyensis]MDN3601633.1 VTT domain-containing protein [Belliella kenyensis]
MKKKEGIFKRLKRIGEKNPRMVIAIAWVSIIPALSSLLLIPLVLSKANELDFSPQLHLIQTFLYVVIGMITMGLALIPTTLFAILSGFLLGWGVFPALIVSYALASLIGYGCGKSLSQDNLDVLLSQYPKASTLLKDKSDNMGELIFFVRISPVIPFALSNLLFAMLRTGWKKLIIWGTLGMLPRTSLAFFSGTIAFDLYSAIHEEGTNGKVWIFIGLLLLSIWGIWRFFTKEQ